MVCFFSQGPMVNKDNRTRKWITGHAQTTLTRLATYTTFFSPSREQTEGLTPDGTWEEAGQCVRFSARGTGWASGGVTTGILSTTLSRETSSLVCVRAGVHTCVCACVFTCAYAYLYILLDQM